MAGADAVVVREITGSGSHAVTMVAPNDYPRRRIARLAPEDSGFWWPVEEGVARFRMGIADYDSVSLSTGGVVPEVVLLRDVSSRLLGPGFYDPTGAPFEGRAGIGYATAPDEFEPDGVFILRGPSHVASPDFPDVNIVILRAYAAGGDIPVSTRAWHFLEDWAAERLSPDDQRILFSDPRLLVRNNVLLFHTQLAAMTYFDLVLPGPDVTHLVERRALPLGVQPIVRLPGV